MPTSTKKNVTFYSLFVWFLAILFYFYEFFLRVLPATFAKDVIGSLNLTMEQFAIISSAYYFTYSAMQTPVGVLLDRFSARLLITIAVGFCSFGVLWFSVAQGFMLAFFARLMIGIGSSFGFVSLMVVTLNWFPKKYFAFLIGCGQFLGALGPLCAGGPVTKLYDAAGKDWRVLFLWAATFGLFLTVLIGIFLRSKPIRQQNVILLDRKEPLKKRLLALLAKRQIWWIFFYTGTIYLALPLLGAFWGTSYFQTRGTSTTAAAFLISMIWFGMAVGSPLFGRLSDLSKRRKPYLCLCSIMGIVGSLFVFYVPISNIYYIAVLLFLVGLGGSGQNISFAVMAEHVPKNLQATALAMNNTVMMGVAAIVPTFVTSLIHYFEVDGHLTSAAFEKGFAVIPLFFILSLLISLFGIKETFCKEQGSVHRINQL